MPERLSQRKGSTNNIGFIPFAETALFYWTEDEKSTLADGTLQLRARARLILADREGGERVALEEEACDQCSLSLNAARLGRSAFVIVTKLSLATGAPVVSLNEASSRYAVISESGDVTHRAPLLSSAGAPGLASFNSPTLIETTGGLLLKSADSLIPIDNGLHFSPPLALPRSAPLAFDWDRPEIV